MRKIRAHEVIALALIACAPQFNAAFAAEDFQEQFHNTYPLTKPGRVRLENVNGNVQVLSWDQDEVKVDAVKHARKPEDLAQVRIEVNAKPDQIEVKTKYPDSRARKGKDNSSSVDYTLTVPKASRLDKVSTVNGTVTIENVDGDVTASSVNGSVAATGLAGEARLSSVNGAVKATFVRVNKGSSLESVNGSVKVALPENVNADVSASTVNGGISNDFSLPTKKNSLVGQNLKAKLGDGGPVIKMSTVNGAIRIDRAKTVALENP